MTEAEILPHLTEWHKAMIDPDRYRQHAEQTLEAYKAAWETVNPSPPTLMGELCTTDHKPEETKC